MTSRYDARVTRGSLLRAGAGVPLVGLLAACSDAGPSAEGPGAGSSSVSSPDPTTPAPSSRSTATTRPSGSAEPTDPAEPAVPNVRPRLTAPLATGLAVPWSIAFLPDGSALVSERDSARIVRVTPRGWVRTVGSVPDVVSNVDQGGEAGLLGLALHPDFPERPWVYAYRSTSSGNQVVRLRYDGGALGRPQVLLDGIGSSVHHNGGGLAFATDGTLFVSTGDAEDPAAAPDRGSLNGKVLRITDRGEVPDGNPFGTPVWSLGHRNVEGLAHDPAGRLWASEFGDQAFDELNLVVRRGDYGWPRSEGRDGRGGARDPLAQWRPDDCSPSGIAVAAGRAWLGALQGQCVFSVELSGPRRGRVQQWFAGAGLGRVRAVAAAPDGSLWIGTSNRDGRADPSAGDDRLLRVTL